MKLCSAIKAHLCSHVPDIPQLKLNGRVFTSKRHVMLPGELGAEFSGVWKATFGNPVQTVKVWV